MSTISNERLEKLSSGNAWTCVQDDEAKAMASELLALRKERERAEPVAWLVCGSKTFKDRTVSTREVAEQAIKDRNDGSCIKPLYTAPPAPTDKTKTEMSQMAEKLVRDTTALAGKAVVPAGWKLVPIEPTKEMLKQIHPFAEATCLDCGNQVVAHCADNVMVSWNDMLAVAPESQK